MPQELKPRIFAGVRPKAKALGYLDAKAAAMAQSRNND
jgi:hypothetical protein